VNNYLNFFPALRFPKLLAAAIGWFFSAIHDIACSQSVRQITIQQCNTGQTSWLYPNNTQQYEF
jgi:hypothetical protein